MASGVASAPRVDCERAMLSQIICNQMRFVQNHCESMQTLQMNMLSR